MTASNLPHGRSRYNKGCRCGTCKAAQRDYRRRQRSKHLTAVPPTDGSPTMFTDGAVTEAVRAQLEHQAIAQERPGLVAIAIRLAQLLDNADAVPQHASAAHRLVETLDKLGQSTGRRRRLTAVRNMTESRDPARR